MILVSTKGTTSVFKKSKKLQDSFSSNIGGISQKQGNISDKVHSENKEINISFFV